MAMIETICLLIKIIIAKAVSKSVLIIGFVQCTSLDFPAL